MLSEYSQYSVDIFADSAFLFIFRTVLVGRTEKTCIRTRQLQVFSVTVLMLLINYSFAISSWVRTRMPARVSAASAVLWSLTRKTVYALSSELSEESA